MNLKRLRNFVASVIILSFSIASFAAPFQNLPMRLNQPDGSILNCYASGDEFHNWLHNEEGYTIIQHPETGFYVYAIQDGDKVGPSNYIAGGTINPEEVGLIPYVNLTEKIVNNRRSRFYNSLYIPEEQVKGEINSPFKSKKQASGTLSNIVIFVQFSNENITNESFPFYEQIYNDKTQSSLYHYFKEVTYNKLAVNTTFVPQASNGVVVWYTDSNPRSYYQPFNDITNTNGYDPDANTGETSRTYREHLLLKNAIEATASQIPEDFEVDAIGDGYVDCVSFIVSGGPEGWSELLWPHRWALFTQEVNIRGKRVWDYTFQLQYTSGTNRVRLGVIAHEMFHVVGAPDLYRYTNSSSFTPVGIWDLMASTTSNPQQMTAYMKYLYGGWIDEIPLLTESGTHTLNQLQESSNNSYRIPSPETHSEYFVVEYRNNSYQYDTSLPGSGLIVYRINDREGGRGNANAPPDEVYVYRPGGDNFTTGQINQAFYSSASGRTAINNQTSPSPILSNGQPGGLNISNIGSTGQTISFTVDVDYDYPIGIKHYKTNGRYSVGANAAKDFSSAVKFTAEDLEDYVGKYFTSIDYFINSGGGTNVTAKVWEGNSANGPGELIYEKNLSTEIQLSKWSLHKLNQSIEIKANTDYWIGYFMSATGGYPIALDNGPMVEGKGGWVKWNDTWQQIIDLSSTINLNRNFLIGAVIQTNALPSSSSEVIFNDELSLKNFPNPFSEFTTIQYSIKQSGFVSLKIYNSLGQVISDLVSDKKPAGEYQIDFRTQNFPSGVYFYRLEIDNGLQGSLTRRMVINR